MSTALAIVYAAVVLLMAGALGRKQRGLVAQVVMALLIAAWPLSVPACLLWSRRD